MHLRVIPANAQIMEMSFCSGRPSSKTENRSVREVSIMRNSCHGQFKILRKLWRRAIPD
jgi:hypothetical protein